MFFTLKSKSSQSRGVGLANLTRKILKRQYFCQLTLCNEDADDHEVNLKFPFP